MNLLKKIPLFLFLLVLFFCLHGSVENYGYINFSDLLQLGIVIFLCISILAVFVFLFYRNFFAASLVSFFISVWYLFFGAIKDWLEGISALSFLASYIILIPILIVLTGLWIFILKKNESIHSKIGFYLNILLVIYCVIDVVFLFIHQFTVREKKETAISFDYSKVTTKPNVYLLLFDEYAGYQSLKDSFGYTNNSFYDFLKQKKFEIIPTFSNYDFTLFSMSSLLNMKYVRLNYSPKKVSQRDFQNRLIEIKDGEVFNIFNKMSYTLNNYSIFDIENQRALSNKNSFIQTNTTLLTDKIFNFRFMRTSGWLFENGKFAIPSWKKKSLHQTEENSKWSQQMVKKLASKHKENPIICYAHFLMPHWPFYRDSSGLPYNDSIIAKSSLLNDKKMYLSYLQYTNTVIESILTEVTTNDPEAIVIIMSDHGFRSYKNTTDTEVFNFNNICAIHFPSNKKPDIPAKISNVNLFRFILNSQFGQNIPFLIDSSIVLSH